MESLIGQITQPLKTSLSLSVMSSLPASVFQQEPWASSTKASLLLVPGSFLRSHLPNLLQKLSSNILMVPRETT